MSLCQVVSQGLQVHLHLFGNQLWCALKEVSVMAKLKLHVFRLKMSAASYTCFEEPCTCNPDIAYLLSGLAARCHGVEQRTTDNFKLEAHTMIFGCALELKLHVFRLKMSAASYMRFEEPC
jgi:hypothetical protein